MKQLLFFFCFLFFSSFHVFAKGVSLAPGVISAGGNLTMTVAKPNKSDAVFGFQIEPEAEYFVTKSLALGSSFKISSGNFVNDHHPWSYGFGLVTKYHLLLSSSVHPYVGLGGDVSWHTNNRPIALSLKFPLGILIPMNNRVALNLGAPFTLVFSQDGYHGLVVPIGYLGIKAFF